MCGLRRAKLTTLLRNGLGILLGAAPLMTLENQIKKQLLGRPWLQILGNSLLRSAAFPGECRFGEELGSLVAVAGRFLLGEYISVVIILIIINFIVRIVTVLP